MPSTYMMYIIDRPLTSDTPIVRIRSATDRVTYHSVKLKDESDRSIRQAVKDCFTWALENVPLNSTFIINTEL